MSSKPDYYAILQISSTASKKDINKSYKRLALERHPDRNGGSTAAFQLLNTAYSTLKDSKSRRQYDRERLKPQVQHNAEQARLEAEIEALREEQRMSVLRSLEGFGKGLKLTQQEVWEREIAALNRNIKIDVLKANLAMCRVRMDDDGGGKGAQRREFVDGERAGERVERVDRGQSMQREVERAERSRAKRNVQENEGENKGQGFVKKDSVTEREESMQKLLGRAERLRMKQEAKTGVQRREKEVKKEEPSRRELRWTRHDAAAKDPCSYREVMWMMLHGEQVCGRCRRTRLKMAFQCPVCGLVVCGNCLDIFELQG